jgi:2'-5' RNA ligase
VKRAQEAAAYPYYDHTPARGLHLTLGRIASVQNITPGQLAAIESAAVTACASMSCFEISTSDLAGTAGALGFNIAPSRPLLGLRDALRAATRLVCPAEAPAGPGYRPHITIAYANTDDVPAAGIIRTADALNAEARTVTIPVTEASLVLLERTRRSYTWVTTARIPLGA